MPSFKIRWEIDIQADTAVEACQEARTIQLDEDSEAVVFEADDMKGNIVSVDLMDLPYLEYHRELQEALHRFDASIELDSDFSDQAFNDGLDINKAVESYFGSGEFDLDTLVPLKGELKPFFEQVRELVRPYAKISACQFSKLEKGNSDLYKTSGGAVVTFGAADGGYALMPLNEDPAKRILDAQ